MSLTFHVIYDAPIESRHRRVGNNQPEQRQAGILEALLDKTRFPHDVTVQRNTQLIDAQVLIGLGVATKPYLMFLATAYQSALEAQDKDWFSEERGLVPYHIVKHTIAPERLAQVPVYKHCAVYGYDTMTPIIDTTFQKVMMSAMNSYLAANLAYEGCARDRVIYALNSQPGHHAALDTMRGYCFLNNAVIAARRLRQRMSHDGDFGKVVILNLDYHMSNGTQELLASRDDDSIVSVSIHGDNVYPNFACFSHDDNTQNCLSLVAGPRATWVEYEQLLKRAFEYLEQMDYRFLIVEFGADTLFNDPDPSNVAGMALTLPDYVKMGEYVRYHKNDATLLITQEGGYSDQVPQVVLNFLHGIQYRSPTATL